jgi:hypothetical protein
MKQSFGGGGFIAGTRVEPRFQERRMKRFFALAF